MCGVVPVEDLDGPFDEGDDDLAELVQPVGLVEVAESVERLQRNIVIACGIRGCGAFGVPVIRLLGGGGCRRASS